MSCLYHRSFARDLAEINAIRKDVNGLLQRFDFAEKQLNNYLLILTEYLSNLIRHNKSESSSLMVEISREPDRLSISIKDGSQLYEPLQALLASEEIIPTLADESGMGMLIIKQLVNDYSYESTKDGCVFTFHTEPHTRSQHVVLLVDDDPVILAVMSEYLVNDYEVISCESVKDAMVKIDDRVPDLIISDIEMPDCDGIAFRQRLARHKQTDRIPFMYLTAVADDKVKDLAISHGIDDYLSKPVAKEDILSGVARILRRQQQRSSADIAIADQAQQTRMLSRLPKQTDDFDISLQQQTADALNGDFVLHHHDGDSDIFILGDVMGHGPEAAFYSYSYSGYIRAYLRSCSGMTLANLATTISDAVFEDRLLEQQLMTLLMIKCSGRSIEVVSAGHPQPFIIKNDQVTPVAVNGPLLGLYPGQIFKSVTLSENDYDAILGYTDGLVDTMTDVTDTNSLADKLQTLVPQSPDAKQLMARIIDQIPVRAQRPVNDDVTCLMLSSRH